MAKLNSSCSNKRYLKTFIEGLYDIEAELKKYVLNFFSNSFVLVISLMSTDGLFPACDAATENAHLDETSLDHGTNRSPPMFSSEDETGVKLIIIIIIIMPSC